MLPVHDAQGDDENVNINLYNRRTNNFSKNRIKNKL